MAFISSDDTVDEESLFVVRPSFLTSANDEDPYSSGGLISVVYPDTKRNLLDAINEEVDNTILPPSAPPILPPTAPPSQKESLSVFLRVKPKTEKESEIVKENPNFGTDYNTKIENVVSVESDYQVAMHAPKESQTYKNSMNGMNGMGKICHRYTFSQIFKQDADQKEIFLKIVKPKVKDFLEGQNQLIFTYGATSAGKTYTIQGIPSDAGIVPRAIDTLFNTVREQVSSDVPLKPVGFSKVVRVTPEDIRQVKLEKETVFRMGIDLKNQQGKKFIFDDLASQGSGSSPSAVGSSSSKEPLELHKIAELFPGLTTRDKDSSMVDVHDDNITYTVWVSYAEIYNENVYDLLQKVPVSKIRRDRVRQNPLKLSEDSNGATFVKGLWEIPVTTANEAYQVLMIGRDNLHFAETRLNHNSSRSHCIFTIKVVRVADKDDPHLARVSLLSFCDLAGSERIGKTNNVGDRQKEAGNINASLLVLGRCIKAIRQNQAVKDVKKHQVVPYRESKLTRIFKTFFSGFGKASLIICISQAPYLFDESIQVLKFASIASKVTIEQMKLPAPKPLRKKITRFGPGTKVTRPKKNSIVSHQAIAEPSGYLGRGTINWEAPRIRSTMLPEQFGKHFDSDLNSSLEIKTGDLMDNAVSQSQQDNLLVLVEDLKEKLSEEKKKNIRQETELREELCKEFNEMMVEVESDWENRLEVEREKASELAEWRITEYSTAVRKEKRKRNDDQESGSRIENLRANNLLENKVKELESAERENVENESVIVEFKKAMKVSNDTQSKLQTENTKMQFELAEMRRMLSEKDKELEKAAKNDKTPVNSGERNDTLEECLAAVKEELTLKEIEVKDMADLLQEVQEDFIGNEEEKVQLETRLKEKEYEVTQQRILFLDLETMLEENKVLLQEANDRLEEKDFLINNLEEAMENVHNRENVDELKEKVAMLQVTLEAEKKVTNKSTNLQIVSEMQSNLDKMNLELENEKRQNSLVNNDDKILKLTEIEERLKLEETATNKLSEAARVAAKEKESLLEEKEAYEKEAYERVMKAEEELQKEKASYFLEIDKMRKDKLLVTQEVEKLRQENLIVSQEFEELKTGVLSVTRLNEELNETTENLKHDNAKLKEAVRDSNMDSSQLSPVNLSSSVFKTPAPPSSRRSKKTFARTPQVKDGFTREDARTPQVKDGFTQEEGDLDSSNNSLMTPRRSTRTRLGTM